MEGEFSFADMVAQDEQRKTQSIIEVDDGEYKAGPASYQSPKQSAKTNNYNYMGGLKDEDKISAMIPTDSMISLMPRQCWDKSVINEESKTAGNINAISTSFLPCGVSIATSSTTDFLTIKTCGVVQLRVLFSRDSSTLPEGGSDAKEDEKVSKGQRHVGGNTQVQVTDVNVPPPSSSSMYSPSDSYTNTSPSHSIGVLNSSTTSLRTPWPCSKVEAMIIQRNSDFPCVISVGTYSSSAVRSSAASTPAGKGQRSRSNF